MRSISRALKRGKARLTPNQDGMFTVDRRSSRGKWIGLFTVNAPQLHKQPTPSNEKQTTLFNPSRFTRFKRWIKNLFK